MAVINLSTKEFKNLRQIQEGTIETGFVDIDHYIGDLKKQELSFMLARNGEGKSTIALQITGHNIATGRKVFYYNGELSDYKYQLWFYTQILGSNPEYYEVIQTKYKKILSPKQEYVKQLKRWHDNKLWVYEQDKEKIKRGMVAFFDNLKAAREHGCELFIIDNVMTALETSATSINYDQTEFARMSKDFADAYDCHTMLLVHPNKDSEELELGAEKGTLKKTSISGSNNLANYGDVIFAVERIFKDRDKMSEGCHGGYDTLITLLKDRDESERPIFKYYFDKETKRLYNDEVKRTVDYGWQKTETLRDKARRTYLEQHRS